MKHVWRVASLLVWGLAGAVGCATGTQEKASDDGGERIDSGAMTKADGSAHPADSSTDTGSSAFDSAVAADTSSPGDDAQISTAVCSLTSTSLCPDGSECCSMSGLIACGCLPGPGTQGDSCSMADECSPGFLCASENGDAAAATCHQWCALPSGTCPAGTQCRQVLVPSPMSGGVTYGACL